MENIKGDFVEPSQNWIDELITFCEKNGLDRKDWSIENDCVPKNIIKRGISIPICFPKNIIG